ncbi:MAG: LemA family protein LemA protein [Candidatus Nomurabacteria bacterium]|nr:LemA family protein LemA protein [Candidatus Nomurabacteria bacterium]
MTWILIALIVIIVLWFFFTYNSLITGRNRSEEAWADIEVQLKRRYDLIPNLVNTVKGYASHESGTLEKVTEARNKAMASQGTAGAAQAEGELSGTLKSLFALSEAYPELKANTNFLSLQTELSDTENKIQAARRFYNGNVRDYNTKIDVSPSNLVAKMFSFTKKEYFDIGDNDVAQQPVEVKF